MRHLLLFFALAGACWAGPRDERLAAFSTPMTFTSTATASWGPARSTRSLRYVLAPCKSGLMATVYSGSTAKSEGALAVTAAGELSTEAPELVNVCNVGAITPEMRRKLIAGESVTVDCRMEIADTVRAGTTTFTRDGEVAEDGSMKVGSKTSTADGKVRLTTQTILAPDGLPWRAETSGMVAKGPLSVKVKVVLTRQ